MKNILSFGIAGRLYAAAGLLALALVGVGVFAYVRLTGVAETARLTAERRVPQLGSIDFPGQLLFKPRQGFG